MRRFAKCIRLLSICGCVFLVPGCGGGDGQPSLTASASGTPTPAPAPTPTPTPTPVPNPFFNYVTFALGQSAGFDFAVLGYRVAGKAGPFENIPDPATIDPTIPIGLAYSGSGEFRISIGGVGENRLVPNGGGGIASADGRTTQFGFSALGGGGSIGEALDFGARPLTSTASGYLSLPTRPSSLYYADDHIFLYGVPTSPTAVPTTGFAEFRSCCDTTYSAIRVDYTSGVLTVVRLGGGTTFIDVALGTDRSTFTGRFGSAEGEGTVDGRFTGPDGREMMLRFIVPGKAAHLLALKRVD